MLTAVAVVLVRTGAREPLEAGQRTFAAILTRERVAHVTLGQHARIRLLCINATSKNSLII